VSKRARLFRLALLTATGGCDDDPGPLHPDVVADIARTPGDAVGYDRTGAIQGLVEALDCPCDPDPAFETLSLCSLVDTAGTGMLQGQLDASQTNGHMVVSLESFVVTGGVDQDGTIRLGAVTNLTSVITRGHVVTRVDGELTETETGDYELDSIIEHRIVGELFLSTDPDVPRSVDCVERLRATGVLR
jgi:hypothetical protein